MYSIGLFAFITPNQLFLNPIQTEILPNQCGLIIKYVSNQTLLHLPSYTYYLHLGQYTYKSCYINTLGLRPTTYGN